MEKKTILAFALSFLVLIAWSFLFGPKQEYIPVEKEGVKGEFEEKQKTAVPGATKGPGAETFAPSIEGEQKKEAIALESDKKEVIVETPLYRAVFSNIGATIKSIQLKQYYTSIAEDSLPVEMVKLQENEGEFFQASLDVPQNLIPEKLIYHVDNDTLRLSPDSLPSDLTFKAVTSEGITIQQTFRFYSDQYPIDLSVTLTNGSNRPIEKNFRASLMNAPPKDKRSYYSFNGIALLQDGKLEELDADDLKESANLSGRIQWIAYEEDYFISAIVPEDGFKGRFQGRMLPSGVLKGMIISPPFSLPAMGQISFRYSLYLGPRDLSILKDFGRDLDRAINFGWTDVIARPLLYTLRFFYKYVKNYGIAIILLTILVKIIFWPLTHKSYKSMKEMQKVQPLMAKIREKHKGNREQINKEMMGLYKTYKINPMGGCLPMVIQIPVFFALFRVLGNSIELRHAPFLFWINDLSAPDRLFNFPFHIPFMDPPYGIPILTLLMGASMFLQQKMTPTPGDPAQAKIMLMLPIVFTVMFINFPSGLVLYWLINNLLSIGQQYRIKKGRA